MIKFFGIGDTSLTHIMIHVRVLKKGFSFFSFTLLVSRFALADTIETPKKNLIATTVKVYMLLFKITLTILKVNLYFRVFHMQSLKGMSQADMQ